MTVPNLPLQGSTDWYAHYAALDAEARKVADKAPTASPTFTGAVAGVTKAHVGLGSVDDTADAAKPVSAAQQTALDARIPLAQKGAADGVASLAADGKVPTAQLPAGTAVSDASTTVKGIVQLAGDLAGTAAVPKLRDTALRNVDAVIFRDETAGTYPLRTTGTTDSLRRVRWVGSVDVTLGGGFALANDVQERRPV